MAVTFILQVFLSFANCDFNGFYFNIIRKEIMLNKFEWINFFTCFIWVDAKSTPTYSSGIDILSIKM